MKHRHPGTRLPATFATLVITLPVLLPVSLSLTQAEGFADPAFQSTWQRTDQPVASGAVKRSFYWGPTPLASEMEQYAEGTGGKRLVQYFDKSRMEINNPAANKSDPFYVTNGLLTVELITGRMQVGNSSYVDRYPAQIPLASDTDDPNAPTYASFGKLMGMTANSTGKAVSQAVARDGTVSPASISGYTAEQTVAYYEPSTGHNIPRVFWDFLNASGPVMQGGKLVTARLSDPWFYAAGLPITEAYWAKVKIAGQQGVDVYIQAYQRRVLTFVPSLAAGFQVQMGNIGQHYFDWRYNNAGQGTGGATPAPTSPTTSNGKIAITGAVKTQESLDVAALSALNAQTVQTRYVTANGSTEQHTYKGPLLLDVLEQAGGQGNGGRDLPIRYIVVTGQGGQQVVLSWGEIDPIFAGKQVILAYQQDGTNLGGTQGPVRLVIPTDKSGARSLYGVTQIDVRTVTPTTPTGNQLKITGVVPTPLVLTAADLQTRPSDTLPVKYQAGGTTESHTYKGVPLLELLSQAGVKSTTQPSADALTRYIVAAGNDGRNAVVAWAEFDPALSGSDVLIAYEESGTPLSGGLSRLVVPGDARGGRDLPYLLSLDVRNASH